MNIVWRIMELPRVPIISNLLFTFYSCKYGASQHSTLRALGCDDCYCSGFNEMLKIKLGIEEI